MSIIFVSELEEVNLRLGWEHPLNDDQKEILRLIVLCERNLKKVSEK